MILNALPTSSGPPDHFVSLPSASATNLHQIVSSFVLECRAPAPRQGQSGIAQRFQRWATDLPFHSPGGAAGQEAPWDRPTQPISSIAYSRSSQGARSRIMCMCCCHCRRALRSRRPCSSPRVDPRSGFMTPFPTHALLAGRMAMGVQHRHLGPQGHYRVHRKPGAASPRTQLRGGIHRIFEEARDRI